MELADAAVNNMAVVEWKGPNRPAQAVPENRTQAVLAEVVEVFSSLDLSILLLRMHQLKVALTVSEKVELVQVIFEALS